MELCLAILYGFWGYLHQNSLPLNANLHAYFALAKISDWLNLRNVSD